MKQMLEVENLTPGAFWTLVRAAGVQSGCTPAGAGYILLITIRSRYMY